MRSSGQSTETDREEDVNPLICIRGSASPGHSYPMTPLHVKNAGDSPMQVTYSANPGYAMTWLKVSPVEILPGESASIPVTLAVPSNAGSGEAYVILTAGGARFDVRFSVGVPPPRECVAAGDKPPQGTSPLVFLWLIVLVVIVLVAFWVRRRLAGRVLTGKPRPRRGARPRPPFRSCSGRGSCKVQGACLASFAHAAALDGRGVGGPAHRRLPGFRTTDGLTMRMPTGSRYAAASPWRMARPGPLRIRASERGMPGPR